jgi:hypothetical protein
MPHHSQQKAKKEGKDDGKRYRAPGAHAQCGAYHHAQHFANRTSRQAMYSGAECDTIQGTLSRTMLCVIHFVNSSNAD